MFGAVASAWLTLAAAAHAAPAVTATRVERPPTIDGKLDDPAWQRAQPVGRFVQRAPSEGRPPSQRTELRVVYDQGAVYFGLRMWDARPELIRRGLGRRDQEGDTDRVVVFIDPVRSGKRGYYFKINASGILGDGLIFQETSFDGSWDGVWSGMARVDRLGWTAELRIPLNSIAFQDLDQQQWGLYVERYVQRVKEVSCWPAMPKSSITFVSRFGRLGPLAQLKRGAALRVLPYVSGEFQLGRPASTTRPDDIFRPGGGLDLRYSFSNGAAFSAAFNPDFGQVEEDPAVVNLSPNEVFWAEKRPFFVEGASLYGTPIRLLHTRRIGARPGEPDASDDGEVTELDPQARIAGAAKLSGDLGAASYGLLSAFVLPSYAEERLASGGLQQLTATPGRNYSAGRLLLRPARSASVGLLFTSMTHLEQWSRDDAYAAGVDWDLRADNGWQTRGQLSAAASDDGSGYGLMLTAGQLGAPRWRYWFDVEAFSPDYQINDVGYQWRNNMVRLRTHAQHRLPSPWRALRELHVTLIGQYGFNHQRPELYFDRRAEVQTWFQFSNFWELWTGGGVRFAVLDDRETRGALPYRRPLEGYCWIGGKTRSTRRVWGEVTLVFASEGQSLYYYAEAILNAALWDRLTLSLLGKYIHRADQPRWLETVHSRGRQRVIFGDMDQDELDLRLSGTLGINRLLTFQVFTQLLYSVGNYTRYRELLPLDDGTGLLGPSTRDSDADFAGLTVQTNAVLRLDLGAGAAAYLVYKLTGSLSRSGRPVAFELGGDLTDLLDQAQLHQLLLKVSYGWDL